jgi:glutamyl/glutaminyl-tRNA synthetase
MGVENQTNIGYRGRLAPSPTGLLHLGHARTFWTAQQRCCQRNGTLVLRNEVLDASRCKAEFVSAMFEDLKWFGLAWQEGPDMDGPFAPYSQSQRLGLYRHAFDQLRSAGAIYPCVCSRQDVLRALQAPHSGEDEPVYPGTCRGKVPDQLLAEHGPHVNWRFRVPDREEIPFTDGNLGMQRFVAGEAFGDFIVWRHDDVPSYQLAVAVDDAAMKISEVVRGQDLLNSTARQVLLYRALGLTRPSFYHCPLVTDGSGRRLAKRHDALSLRALRRAGAKPEDLRGGE